MAREGLAGDEEELDEGEEGAVGEGKGQGGEVEVNIRSVVEEGGLA